MLGTGVGLWRGGRLAEVVHLRLRRWPLLVAAVAIQLSLGWLPTATRWILVLICCGLVLAWTLENFGVLGTKVGLALLLAGILANTVVIAANRGMPVDVHALVISGRSAHTNLANGFLFKHATMTPHTSLSWLADRIPIPLLEEVVSFGDLLMLGGLAIIFYRATLPPLRRSGRQTTSPTGFGVERLESPRLLVETWHDNKIRSDLRRLQTTVKPSWPAQ